LTSAEIAWYNVRKIYGDYTCVTFGNGRIVRAQRNGPNVTRWIAWFVACHQRAVEAAEKKLAAILDKAAFWQAHAQDDWNAHQREMLNRLLDGFEGNLSSSKWAKICKVSQDTASREIAALVSGGILRQVGQGRSTHYELIAPC